MGQDLPLGLLSEWKKPMPRTKVELQMLTLTHRPGETPIIETPAGARLQVMVLVTCSRDIKKAAL